MIGMMASMAGEERFIPKISGADTVHQAPGIQQRSGRSYADIEVPGYRSRRQLDAGKADANTDNKKKSTQYAYFTNMQMPMTYDVKATGRGLELEVSCTEVRPVPVIVEFAAIEWVHDTAYFKHYNEASCVSKNPQTRH